MNKIYPIILGIILILVLSITIYYIKSGNLANDNLNVGSNKESLNMQVVYYFNFWGGGENRISIDENGLVKYEAKNPPNKEWETKSIQLNDNEIKELKVLLNEPAIFALNNEYYCKSTSSCGTDYSYASLKFTTSDRNKEISFDDSTILPPKLKEIFVYFKDLIKRFY